MTLPQVFQVIGGFYLLFGLSALINPRVTDRLFKHLQASLVSIYLNALVLLFLGILLIASFYESQSLHDTLLTLTGWVAVAKAVLMLIVPGLYMSLTKKLKRSDAWLEIEALISVCWGGFLVIMGFWV